MDEPEPEQPPLTPSYDGVPIPEHPPEATAKPAPAPAAPIPAKQQRQRKPKPTPKRKQRKPRKYAEWDDPQFRHDQKILDLQTRVLSLRNFLQSHDLWEIFLSQTAWW